MKHTEQLNDVGITESHLRQAFCIELKVGWTFTLRDHLSDTFSGTRLEAVQYLKRDIAQNLENYLTQSEILENLKEKRSK